MVKKYELKALAFKKALASLVAASVLCAGAFAAAAAASTEAAYPTESAVLVDGAGVAFGAYNINGYNYFKLRDLACALSGTAKQFEVGWDGANDAISLTSGVPYTAAGGEMAGNGAAAKTASPTSSKVYLDGREVKFTAYNIDGNNYFKLRDIGGAVGFGVSWDEARDAVIIDTGGALSQGAGGTGGAAAAGANGAEAEGPGAYSLTTGWIASALNKSGAEAVGFLRIDDGDAVDGIGGERYYVRLFASDINRAYVAFDCSQFETVDSIEREGTEVLYVIPMGDAGIRFGNGFVFYAGGDIKRFKDAFGEGEYETYSNLKGDKETYHLQYLIDGVKIEFSSYSKNFYEYTLMFSKP